MTIMKNASVQVAALAAAALFALGGQASAQQLWPGTCVCKPNDPRGANLRYARYQVDDKNLAALKARFYEIANEPMQKSLTFANACTNPKICTDRNQVVADEASVTIKVIGLAGDDELFDAGNVLQLARLKPGVPLVFYGAKQ